MTLKHVEIQIKDDVVLTWHISDKGCRFLHGMNQIQRSKIMLVLTWSLNQRDNDQIRVLTWQWTMRRYRSKIMLVISYMTLNHDERDTDQRRKYRSKIIIHDTEPWGDTDQRSCRSYMTLNREEIQMKDHVVLTWQWTMRRYRSKIM